MKSSTFTCENGSQLSNLRARHNLIQLCYNYLNLLSAGLNAFEYEFISPNVSWLSTVRDYNQLQGLKLTYIISYAVSANSQLEQGFISKQLLSHRTHWPGSYPSLNYSIRQHVCTHFVQETAGMRRCYNISHNKECRLLIKSNVKSFFSEALPQTMFLLTTSITIV